jgi:hypothetical protein
VRRTSRKGARSLGKFARPAAAALVLAGAAPAAAELAFTDVTADAGVLYLQGQAPLFFPELPSGLAGFSMNGGAAVGDVDGDGWPDLFVTRVDAPDLLFRNRGDGTFEDFSGEAGLDDFDLHTNGAVFADFDNDDDPDLYVTALVHDRFFLFVNDGTGRFREEAVPRGAALQTEVFHFGQSVATGDYDRDGWLDLHTDEWRNNTHGLGGTPSHARLLRNLGSGFFEDRTEGAGVLLDGLEAGLPRAVGTYAFASAFVDLDRDGWQDLAISSDFGKSRLFWNNGDGTFTDGTEAAGVGTDQNGMGSTFGDYDGDGDLDWFVTAVGEPPAGQPACLTTKTGNRLYRYEGERIFSDATDEAGVRQGFWGWGTVFFDYDNDGDLDLVMTNGWANNPCAVDPMRLWRNDGGVFTEVSADLGVTETRRGMGLLTFDYDDDGDLDLFVVHNTDEPVLYRNDGGNENDWLRVAVEGTVSNRDGIGARVVLTAETGGPAQVREIGVASHFLGQSERVAHFGLGAAGGPVAEVRVEWPSGRTQVFRDVPRRSTLRARETDVRIWIHPRLAHDWGRLFRGALVAWLRARRPIAVSILGSESVRPHAVEVTALRFGPAGAEPMHDLARRGPFRAHVRDVDRDGFADLQIHFAAPDTGLGPGDVEACLEGEIDGQPFLACDEVRYGLAARSSAVGLALLALPLAWLGVRRRRG